MPDSVKVHRGLGRFGLFSPSKATAPTAEPQQQVSSALLDAAKKQLKSALAKKDEGAFEAFKQAMQNFAGLAESKEARQYLVEQLQQAQFPLIANNPGVAEKLVGNPKAFTSIATSSQTAERIFPDMVKAAEQQSNAEEAPVQTPTKSPTFSNN